MKLNNKGFAITGILYTVLIMFLLLLSSLLLMLTTRINRLIKLTDSINKEVENNNIIDIGNYDSTSAGNENKISNPIDGTKYFITSYRGKYEFYINDDNSKTCYSYLPENTLLSISGGILKYKLPTLDESGNYVVDTSNLTDLTDLIIFDCQNQNINRVNFTKVYTSTTADMKEQLPSSTIATEYIESLLPGNLETMNNDDPDGNVRYMGADPNNYVLFNNELWRIIGVFSVKSSKDGQYEKRLKIIRNESLSKRRWDEGTVNDWSQASLQEYLNGEYYNGLTSESQILVGDTYWNLGGSGLYTSASNGLVSHFYDYERGTTVCSGRPTYWIGKIGLMSPSDYGYATSGGITKNRKLCLAKEMYNWNSSSYSDCKNNDYIYDSSSNQWTIIPSSSVCTGVYSVYATGNVLRNNVYASDFSIFPVLYLKATVKITGGEGTSSSPYILG